MKIVSGTCFFLLLLVASGLSCSKDNEQPGNNSSACLVSRFKRFGTENTLIYDTSGRLQVSTLKTDTGSMGKSVFLYHPNIVVQVDSSNVGPGEPLMATWVIRYLLNDKGLATVAYGALRDIRRDTIYYTYNNDGYMIQSVRKGYSSASGWSVAYLSEAHYYTIAGGNIVRDSSITSISVNAPALTRVYSYSYYEGTTPYPTHPYSPLPLPMLGKENVSLLKTRSVHVNGALPLSQTYTYTMDADNKPVAIQIATSSELMQATLEYICP